ncbi:hypothetical protein Y032_0095g2809 [Ancylostoma ceylanicum]|uniref:Uncharacterized protein n=1 Tax=Ancylostoma ceylanicum TaxID=53326 RepID=A0A016TKL0_9BILA|nr:hypothetical protein Y032_0095g2809 [Ancylostoma ceylanicum]
MVDPGIATRKFRTDSVEVPELNRSDMERRAPSCLGRPDKPGGRLQQKGSHRIFSTSPVPKFRDNSANE